MAQATLPELLDLKKPNLSQENFGEIKEAIETLNPEYGNIYSSQGFSGQYYSFKNYSQLKNFLETLGFPKNTPDKYYGIVIDNWYESATPALEYSSETITEVPRPTGPAATTLTSEQLENLGENAEKRSQQKADIQARERQAIKDYIKQNEERIAKAKSLQEKLKDKVVYAKVVIPESEKLSQDEQQKLKVLINKANNDTPIAGKLLTPKQELIDDFTLEIEKKLEPVLKDLPEKEKEIIARTYAVEIVEKIANPETVVDERVQTVILDNIAKPKQEAVTKILQKNDELITLAKNGAVLIATKQNDDFSALEKITANLVGPKIASKILRTQNYQVTFSEVQVQGETTHTVRFGELNQNQIQILTQENGVLTTLQQYGQQFGYDKVNSVFTNYAGTFLKEKIESLSAGNVIKKAYKDPIIQSIFARYGMADPVVWQAVGQSRFVGLVMKIAPDTAGPILNIAGRLSGSEYVTGIVSLSGGAVGAGLAAQTAATTASVTLTGGIMAGEAFAGGAGGAAAGAAAGSTIAPIIGTAIGAAVGALFGKAASAAKVWWTKHKDEVKPVLAVLGTLAAIRFLGVGPGLGVGAVATFGLMGTAGIATIATGAFGVLGFIGRSVGIAVATPVIITLLVIPPLVAFIMLVINNSAYVVPPAPPSTTGSEVITSPYIDIIKTPNPPGPFENSDLPLTVEYTVEIKAKKSNLTNVSINYECAVLKKDGSAVCPKSEPEIPTTVENGISPTTSFKFTYKHTYNALSYTDSFITDTITVNADTIEQDGITAAGSATIKIGEPPEDCPSIWPTSHGRISQGAISRQGFSHHTTESIDVAVGNTGVFATHTGTVVMAERDSCYGNRVRIKSNCNGKDFISQYAHLEGISVRNGQAVTMGQSIGLSGNTGSCTTGPHLHYEFRYYPDGKPSFPGNPPFMMKPYIPENIKRGCSDEYDGGCGVSF